MSLPILTQRKFQPEFALWAIFVHLGGLILLPLYFSWGNLLFGFIAAAVTAYSMGIFHHMYFSHSSFKAHPALENLGALLGTLTWRGPMAAPLRYVALHRVHHAYSDREADPHSPVHGIFHALLGWNWNFAPVFADQEQYLRWSGPHRKNTFLLFLDRHVHLMQAAWALVLFLVGGTIGFFTQGNFDLENAAGVMVYGVFAKTLFVIYLANSVDVINHGPGYRNYETSDQSTNSFLMAMVHLGGAVSWHNNHHAKQQFFTVKKRWWEFDVHHMWLRALEKVGLVSDIKVLDESQPVAERKLTHFLSQDAGKATLMITTRLLQVILPVIAYLGLFSSQGIYVQALGLALLSPLAAVGLHNLALLGHEGTHFNLSKDKLGSSLLGTFLASMVPFHFNTGFALSHAAHHVHTNTDKDPDIHVFGPFQGAWRRLIVARRAASLAYFRGTVAAALGKDGIKLPGLKERELKIVAWFNLAVSVGFLALYAFLMVNVAGFALFFGLSYALTYMLSALRPYLEHAGTDTGKFSNARTFSSASLDFVFGGINYHLAHHLYPRVPAYRMAEFQRWLEEQPDFGAQERVTGHEPRALYRAATRLPYGKQRKDVAG
jgi:beta-carotene hydroxylase